MNEPTIEEEIKRRDENIKRVCNMLIDLDINFEIKDWESGEGKDIIMQIDDEDDDTIKHKLYISFYNSGYTNVSVGRLDGVEER